MKPIIGISTAFTEENNLTLSKAYYKAVIAAGGAPVALPNQLESSAELLKILDGVLFSGGVDVHSKYFNQPLHEKVVNISAERDTFEIEFFKMVKAANKPIMGICRGMQLLNIVLGGDLIQHIDNHAQKEKRYVTTHKVNIVPGTKLHSWLKDDKIAVNSFHHQVVDKIPDNCIISARSEDGYIEAIEYTGDDWFCFGVQWHPEAMLEDIIQLRQLELFKPFIEACKKK